MSEKFETWGYVEIMGHTQVAGRLSEESVAGTMLLRVDVPHGDSFRTQYQGGASIFAIHPTDEATARAIAGRLTTEPPYRYMLPVLSAPSPRVEPEDGDPEEEFDEDEREFGSVGRQRW